MLIDGKKIAQEIHEKLRDKVNNLDGRKPGIALILVGDHPASKAYVKYKEKACQFIGFHSEITLLPKETTEAKLLETIEALNCNQAIDGILVQLPLPPQINTESVLEAISPKKDVDGFHPINVGKLFLGQNNGLIPCTPKGIITIFEKMDIETTGKEVVIVGRSQIVGKPLAALLMQNSRLGNATVTVVHSRSQNLEAICKRADILIVAIGKAEFVNAQMVKKGAIVIDVGINRDCKNHSIIGDVEFNSVSKCASMITPVPGGVGPMTIASLMENTWIAYERNNVSIAVES